MEQQEGALTYPPATLSGPACLVISKFGFLESRFLKLKGLLISTGNGSLSLFLL